ncbi:hypothetical protein J2847_000425 [Azospirillum agricola]|uniref:AAA family ATPase n=1 Tax=Azospirillum agricola TaxID=1720247 RepID=UPI001AE38E85|nr:AAA family ATPase [Azospirillum agricola]MBP2227158.1 hypothetical protein [Azospirillum agricola]
MKIISYGCRGYKPFKEQACFEIRPLTLIFGKNNSGKSAGLRLLRLLLRSLSARLRGSFPLNVDGLVFGANFRDLVHEKLPHGAIAFDISIECDSDIFNLSATVQNVSDTSIGQGRPSEYNVVSKFLLRSPLAVTLIWTPSRGTVGTYEGIGPVPFRGLLPEVKGAGDREQWRFAEEWRERIQALEGRLEHLGPHRAEIARVYEMSAPREIGFDGSGAPSMIANNDILLSKVASWYQKNLDEWMLSINQSGSAFECILKRGESEVNLADAGQGMQQVLPIIVQQSLRQLEDNEYFIDLIEQPELHLHTAAQAPLGDLFLDTAKAGRGQVIVETHSENLLLRIRRRIAEGADPNLVAVYWIEDHPEGHSSIRRININRLGELSWWQEGIFSEGYEEVKAIRRASRTQKGLGGNAE